MEETRSLEDVKAAAKIAGIPPNARPVQLLRFSPSLATDNIKLLQLTEDVTHSLQIGQRVVIKGQKSDDAVLCTEESTYELRVCETSNSLLLCPDLLYPGAAGSTTESKGETGSSCVVDKEVIGSVSDILEVKKCRPKLERLQELLSEAPYKGPLEERINEEAEPSEQNRKYTLSELFVLVQASESEIMRGLKKLQACLIDGCWRIMDLDYRDELVQHVLTLLEEEDWSWKKVPLSSCCEKLSELHPPFAIKHCLDCYGTPHEEGEGPGEGPGEGTGIVYELDEEKICKFFAEILLRPAAGRFNYHEFISCWQQSVPLGMNTNIAQLKGLALRDTSAMPPVVWFYPVENLPKEPSERFASLFSVREKWSYEDLEPYIKDMVTSSTTLNSLLLKYTRSSTSTNGIKLYNSKANN